MIPEPLTKVLLYGGAPFFAYPWKPALNAVEGRDYARAYSHFRRDHQNPLNLLYHCFCLVFQLGFNYALLNEAGTALAAAFGGGLKEAAVLPAATSAAWAWTCLRAPAPIPVRVFATGAIVLAHQTRHLLGQWWHQAVFFTGVLEALCVQVFVINKAKDTSGRGRAPFSLRQFLGVLAVRWGAHAVVTRTVAGSLASPAARAAVNGVLALWMLRVCQDPFGAKSKEGKMSPTTSPFFLGPVGWLLALLTDQSWLYFYSGGFLASMSQGVAHYYTGEEGTLPQLAQVGDELAHTTFFPDLLLHSVYQSLRFGKGRFEKGA